MIPGVNIKPLPVLFVLCVQIAQIGPLIVPVLSKQTQIDNNWFPHFQLAESALKAGDLETACKEADIILKMAAVCDNKLPAGANRGYVRSYFSDYIRDCAKDFQYFSGGSENPSDPPAIEHLMAPKDAERERQMQLKYAGKLYQIAVDIEIANADLGLARYDMTSLTECLKEQDKTAEIDAALKKWDKVLASANLLDPCIREEVLPAQAERLEQEHKLDEAEAKLKLVIADAEKNDTDDALKKTMAKNIESLKDHGGVSLPWAELPLTHLAEFYQRTQQYQKEEETYLKILALDAKVMPDNSFCLGVTWMRLADCYRHEGKNAAAAEADKKAAAIHE
jgi:tetratricopeptide (TPR) repeat protein